jgi:hypothetical protein
MALDTTVGGSATNSYLTLDEFNEYLTNHVSGAAGLAVTPDAKKEAGLITATRLIDVMFLWNGAAASETQRRAFPRTGLLTRNGFALASDIHPVELKEATAELARLLLATDTTAPSSVSVQGLTQITAGPVTLKFKDLIELKIIPESVWVLIPRSWYERLATDPEPPTFDFEVMQSEPSNYRSRSIHDA